MKNNFQFEYKNNIFSVDRYETMIRIETEGQSKFVVWIKKDGSNYSSKKYKHTEKSIREWKTKFEEEFPEVIGKALEINQRLLKLESFE
jgi:hypothetical protein